MFDQQTRKIGIAVACEPAAAEGIDRSSACRVVSHSRSILRSIATMIPSFDARFFLSKAYVDFVISELRRGRVARTVAGYNDNAWSASTVTTTSYSAEGGFRRDHQSSSGVGTPVHQPGQDRSETGVSEAAIRHAIAVHRAYNGFRDVLVASILEDLEDAVSRGDRTAQRAHAARLIGPSSPERAAPFDEVVRSLDAGDRDEARALAELAIGAMDRPGVEVFGLLIKEVAEPLSDGDRAALLRVETWLAALAELFPTRGEFSYWRSAAFELLGRREEALALYARARTIGKVTDYHSRQRPADLDPRAGRRALRTLQKASSR